MDTFVCHLATHDLAAMVPGETGKPLSSPFLLFASPCSKTEPHNSPSSSAMGCGHADYLSMYAIEESMDIVFTVNTDL